MSSSAVADGTAAVASPASAAPDVLVPPFARPFSIALEAGVGAPLGYAGVAFHYTPAPWVSLGAGFGSNASGLQEAAMVWFGRRGPAVSVSLGLGASTGPFASQSFDLDAYTRWTWNRAWWFNAEVSFEHRFDSGIELRWFGGIATMMDSRPTTCINHDDESGEDSSCSFGPDSLSLFADLLPYAGLSIGYAFSH